VIEVQEVVKAYRKGAVTTEVLRGVSFDVRQGEFVAIMGRSGSGKSTLLNVLGFLDRPDSGQYRFQGEDLSPRDDDTLSDVRSRKVGFVFQQFYLLDRASAIDNVTLPLLYVDDDTGGEQRARSLLADVGLSDRANNLPGELSGGEQQRVAIARALINDPPLILADEPTGNLDEKSATEVLDIFRRSSDGGRTIVIVTHDPLVAQRADRILRLEDGRIVGGGARSDASGPSGEVVATASASDATA
jgi:putative ABC transport system ATP-binding protein